MILSKKDIIQGRLIRGGVPGQKAPDDGYGSLGYNAHGYDLRLDTAHAVQISAKGLSMRYGDRSGGHICLDPGARLLASAMELVNLRSHAVLGMLHNKSTHARRGLQLMPAIVDAGFEGKLTLSFYNASANLLWLKHGEGIANITFHACSDCGMYSGKYQGATRPEEAKRG